MRVGYVINRYPSVSHTFIRREIAALEQLGIEVARFSVRAADGTLPDPADRAEVARTVFVLAQGSVALMASLAIVALRSPAKFVRAVRALSGMMPLGRGRFVRACAYLAEGAWLARRSERSKIRHLHAHFGTNSTTVARLASILSGIPYSFTVHGPEEFDSVNELGLAGKISDASFVAAITAFCRSQLFRHLSQAEWGKVRIVPCGLDFQTEESVAELSSASYDFCFVGRFAPQKGLPTLAEALREIARRGERVSVVMIGDGEMLDWFAGFCADEGISSSVTLLGRQGGSVINAALRASGALLVPSYAEGLPIVLMEAFANSRPVISTFVAGIPELVTPDCGILVPAGDAAALADAMLRMKSLSVAERDAMGAVGRSRVVQRHDIRTSGALLAEAFSAGQ